MYATQTASHHFLSQTLDSLSEALASIIAVEDTEVRKELAATFLLSSFLTLSNSVGKDTLKTVGDALKKEGLI